MLLACREDLVSATGLKLCLDQYCEWSGQSNNFEKSHILFSSNTNRGTRKAIKDLFGLKELRNDFFYLGNTFLFGRGKLKDFKKLKDKVQARLEGWRSKMLSQAWKMTLVKAVAMAILVYSMLTFRVPK